MEAKVEIVKYTRERETVRMTIEGDRVSVRQYRPTKPDPGIRMTLVPLKTEIETDPHEDDL
jgi:hypothetical protein